MDSTPMLAATLFQDHVTRPFSPVHKEIFKVLDDESIRLAAIAAPRGFGKTTLIGLCYPARKSLFRQCKYIVYVSSTQTEAGAKLKTFAQEITTNELLKSMFGNLKGAKWAEEKGELVLCDDQGDFCFIQAKGAGSQIRGLKWGRHRPDLIIIDDLEDKEGVENDDTRKKLKEWFFGDVLGALDQAEDSKCRLIVIGTVLHEDSLLANLIDEKEELDPDTLEIDAEAAAQFRKREMFHTVRLEACDDNLHSIWPEYMSDASIRAKYKAYERRGELDIFYREYRNIVIAKEKATFQDKFFRRYGEHGKWFKDEVAAGLETVVIVDPAKTVNKEAAKTAIIAVGLNTSLPGIFLRDVINENLTPDQIFQEACDMADRFNTSVIGFDVTGLNNFATYPFEQFISTRGKHYELVELKLTKDKDERIACLAPFYRMYVMYHNEAPHVCGPIEAQLMSFPRSKFKDVMDCLANVIPMFDLGKRAFSPQKTPENSPHATELKKLQLSEKDEFKLLEEEDRLEGKIDEWRLV